MLDSQSRDPGFKSPLLTFRNLGIFVLSTMPQFTQPYLNVYMYLAVNNGGNVFMKSSCVIAAWLNASQSQRSRVGVGTNRFAGGEV